MTLRNESTSLTALDVVLLALFAVTVGGGALLLSAAETKSLVDGAIAWREDSLLRTAVRLLCLDYQFPTTSQGEVKNYLLGMGAGLVVLVLSISMLLGGKESKDSATPKGVSPTNEAPASGITRQVSPLLASQFLIVLYVLWSFASNGWSAAPELAVGGSLLLAAYFTWSMGIGRGLTRHGATIAGAMLVAITTATALMAVWYYYGRNPVLRAKFPIGNPTFLAACLIPGMLLAAALGMSGVERIWIGKEGVRGVRSVLVSAAVFLCVSWAFVLADARGSFVGLAAGILALVFFRVRGKWKSGPALAGLTALIVAWAWFDSTWNSVSPTGRSESLRLRGYAWSYALQLFQERPFTGHGQGGFVLKGDALAVRDVLHDPAVFEARIDHAHNEWLEVMTDLGAVGIVLLGGALVLTFQAGAQTLRRTTDDRERWVLLGLLAGLFALAIEECFGVGLRVSGVPTFFYSALGLTWALCRAEPAVSDRPNRVPGWMQSLVGVLGFVAGVILVTVVHGDFADARKGYRVEQAVKEEKYDEAIRLASQSTHRLNPQRSLEGYYRLGEAHMISARTLQRRAVDREERARRTPELDSRLPELAQQDRAACEDHCMKGSTALRELIRRCPGYLHHGWIAYWINVLQANNAEARGDRVQRDLFASAAGAAVEAELQRQPFNPLLAECFVRVAYGKVEWGPQIEVLARPLRYHRIGGGYGSVLREFLAESGFEREGISILQSAREEAEHGGSEKRQHDGQEIEGTWGPEKLRLFAAYFYLRGQYEPALEAVELAARAYGRFAGPVHFGAAACYAELAVLRFINNPEHTGAAMESSERALGLAPDSEAGRSLKFAVKQQMVEYCLASGDEARAATLLRETGPMGVNEEAIARAMGVRYRQLAQSLLIRRRQTQTVPKPANEMIPQLQSWVRRALELEPDDPEAHFLAADLAFHRGHDEEAADHLRDALDRGLPVEEVQQFLAVTREKNPDSRPLNDLRNALQPPGP